IAFVEETLLVLLDAVDLDEVAHVLAVVLDPLVGVGAASAATTATTAADEHVGDHQGGEDQPAFRRIAHENLLWEWVSVSASRAPVAGAHVERSSSWDPLSLTKVLVIAQLLKEASLKPVVEFRQATRCPGVVAILFPTQGEPFPRLPRGGGSAAYFLPGTC